MAAAVPAVQPELQEREEYEERVRSFSNYLHSNREVWEKKIEKELANDRYRINLELSDLEKTMKGISSKLLAEPVKYILPWQEALMSFLKDINEKAVKSLSEELKLDISGSFGRNSVTPRGLTANTLHQLMCIEGVITKAAVKEPKIVQSMHVRKNGDGTVISRDQRDQTAFVDQARSGVMPTHDQEGYELEMEIGLSHYKDQQKFTVQEAPDQAPPGQIPRSVEVICDGDLCDQAKPGDRVQVIGVYRGFPPPAHDFSTGVWPARVIATNVSQVNKLVESSFVSQDVKNIKRIAERPDAFELLARSFAPSICGHTKVKSGLLLQLIGGTTKDLENGTHLRGDINVLLVGDPSCGKSQMLRFVMNTAPLAISTTGRGSSGVGLTAAMIREPGSRDFHIEAGAMVLADKGVICIDEFDKMGQADRVAIHEAMEQQVVTIAKAGMHVTLNARCSVVAAANPIYGNFDPKLDLAKNIGLPDSLLSRFDLVYVVRDLTDEFIDKKIASQVLHQAREGVGTEQRRRGVEQVFSSMVERRHQQADRQQAQEATEVFVRQGDGDDESEGILTVDFLQKYVRYCKRFAPRLTEEARTKVADKYVDMRMRFQSGFTDIKDPQSNKKPRLAVTTRTLEALIRLATAHAKLKLRKDEVLPEDVDKAYELMLGAREEEPVTIPAPAEDVDDGDDGADDGGDDPGAGPGPSRKRGREADDAAEPGAKAASTGITAARYRVFETLVGRTFGRAQMLSELAREDLLDQVNAELGEGEERFSSHEFDTGIAKLEMANKVFVTETGDIALLG